MEALVFGDVRHIVNTAQISCWIKRFERRALRQIGTGRGASSAKISACANASHFIAAKMSKGLEGRAADLGN